MIVDTGGPVSFLYRSKMSGHLAPHCYLKVHQPPRGGVDPETAGQIIYHYIVSKTSLETPRLEITKCILGKACLEYPA